jgi:gas vesicle protein
LPFWQAQGCYVARSITFVWAVPLGTAWKEENMNTTSQEFEYQKSPGRAMSALIGLVIGSMAGAITVLLFAPQPGEKTRAELQDGVLKFRKQTAARVNDTVTQVKSKASQIKAGMQVKAEDLKHQGQDLLVKQLDNVSQAAEAGKKAIQGNGKHTAA